MGNEVDAKFRGEGDIPLTELLSHLTDDQFKQFCQDGEAAGALDSSEFANKHAMIARLPAMDLDLKKNVMKNMTEGRKPFEN